MIAIFFLIVAIITLMIVSWVAWYYYKQSKFFEENNSCNYKRVVDLHGAFRSAQYDADNLEQENTKQNEYIEKLQQELATLRSDIKDRDNEINALKEDLAKCRKVVNNAQELLKEFDPLRDAVQAIDRTYDFGQMPKVEFDKMILRNGWVLTNNLTSD